jgi:cellobiose-specific phosphotransferase system component IIC
MLSASRIRTDMQALHDAIMFVLWCILAGGFFLILVGLFMDYK